MFIEKYQPYTSLIITYGGMPVTEEDTISLPALVTGEYKINFDVIGVDDVDEREALPFTRNDVTWWIVNPITDTLVKEFEVPEYNVPTKFTIDDSGTFTVISEYFEAPENTSIPIICVLGIPRTFDIEDFDPTIDVFAYTELPFISGGGGGVASHIFYPLHVSFTYVDAQADAHYKPIMLMYTEAYYDEITGQYTPKASMKELRKGEVSVAKTLVQGSRIIMYTENLTNTEYDIGFKSPSALTRFLTVTDKISAVIDDGYTILNIVTVNTLGEENDENVPIQIYPTVADNGGGIV